MLFWWPKLLCYESYRGSQLAVPHVGTYQRIFTAYKWIENDHTANDCGSCVVFPHSGCRQHISKSMENNWISSVRFQINENGKSFTFLFYPLTGYSAANGCVRLDKEKNEQLDRSTLYLYISNAIFHLAFLSHRIWLNEMRQRNRFRL